MKKLWKTIDLKIYFLGFSKRKYAKTKYKGLIAVEHGGGYPGVSTYVSMIPDKNLAVVVLTNFQNSDPARICHKAEDILLDL